MTGKHTPGPWRWIPMYGPDGKKHDGRFYIDSDTHMVGNVEPCAGMPVAQSHANAALLASAPDLLTVAEDTAETVRRYDDGEIDAAALVDYIRRRADEARAALAKARGA